ncbi:MAG: ethylbenzene dehydrogenase-related protein, partial [Methanopyri archaeon]|nr:ethylbenzene dehydrogenase-related protein [Methanopyri archaeon]
MKMKTVVIVSIILVLSFLALVIYGFIRSVEGPVGVEEPEISEAPFVDRDIDLSTGISLDVWDTLPPTEVELVYQLTVLPWPARGLLPPIAVKAFHNGKDIYLYVSWEDGTED